MMNSTPLRTAESLVLIGRTMNILYIAAFTFLCSPLVCCSSMLLNLLFCAMIGGGAILTKIPPVRHQIGNSVFFPTLISLIYSFLFGFEEHFIYLIPIVYFLSKMTEKLAEKSYSNHEFSMISCCVTNDLFFFVLPLSWNVISLTWRQTFSHLCLWSLIVLTCNFIEVIVSQLVLMHTLLMKSEEKLQQVEASRVEMMQAMSNVAHDLKTVRDILTLINSPSSNFLLLSIAFSFLHVWYRDLKGGSTAV